MSEQLPDPAPVKTSGVSTETSYVILKRGEGGGWSMYADDALARSSEAAIRAVGKEGTYVAIPARSFKPVTVKAEVVTTLKLEDAT